jgi:hypothetical protein
MQTNDWLSGNHQESKSTIPAQLISHIMMMKPITVHTATPVAQRHQLWKSCLHLGQRLDAMVKKEAQCLQYFVRPAFFLLNDTGRLVSINLLYAGYGLPDLCFWRK